MGLLAWALGSRMRGTCWSKTYRIRTKLGLKAFSIVDADLRVFSVLHKIFERRDRLLSLCFHLGAQKRYLFTCGSGDLLTPDRYFGQRSRHVPAAPFRPHSNLNQDVSCIGARSVSRIQGGRNRLSLRTAPPRPRLCSIAGPACACDFALLIGVHDALAVGG